MASLSAFVSRTRAPTSRLNPRVSTRKVSPAVIARAEPSESSAAPATATVYFGGKEYTEEQWAAAVASGQVAAAAPVPVSSSSAGAAAISLADAMAFSGPAPELINSRLAMLGFASAVAAEIASDETVLQQWASEPTGIALTFALIAAASFPPLLAGRTNEKLGPFTPEAEKLNGRAAMIGFAAILLIESFKHSALF